ncbi:MAG: hypothetical protein GC151_02580 [Betaproteobacteria bacterium]|nr:hypothetical protein [Betaproteobacteria bacterium]
MRIATLHTFPKNVIAAAIAAAMSTSAHAVTFLWSTGNFDVSGVPGVLVPPDTLGIASGGTKYLNAGFANQSTVTATDTIYVFNGSTLTNDGTYDLHGDVNLANAYGGYFVNGATGVLRKSDGVGVSDVNLTFTNDGGTIEAQTGTIRFGYGNAVFNDGSRFQGAGQIVVSSNASFSGSIGTSGNLFLTAGTLTGATTGGAVLGGDAHWSGGSLAGIWTVGAGRTLDARSGAVKYVNATLSNQGTIAATDDVFVYGGMRSPTEASTTFRETSTSGILTVAAS